MFSENVAATSTTSTAQLTQQGGNPPSSPETSFLLSHFYSKQGEIQKGLSLYRIVEQKSALRLNSAQLRAKMNFGKSDTVANAPQILSASPHAPQDMEGSLYKSLLYAKKCNLIDQQISYLEKLSDLYLSKNDYTKAALLLNGALLLLQQKQPSNTIAKKNFIAKLTIIEEKFLNSKGFKGTAQLQTHIERHRAFLDKIRADCQKQFDSINKFLFQQRFCKSFSKIPTKLDPLPALNLNADTTLGALYNIPNVLTEGFKTLLKMLIEEAQVVLGPPPVEWACIGMGSMARSEMCPRSDIEFAFLLSESTNEGLLYFRRLSELLELQIINLGETKFPIFAQIDPDHPSITPSGFSIDTGGNTPLGVKGVYELIGTPKELAKFVGSQGMKRSIILSNAMSTVCWVAGQKNLMDQYHVEKDLVLDTLEGKQTNREELAFGLLAGHLEEFAPNLTSEKEQSQAFGVKKELYRPFQEVLSCLSLFYKLKETSSFNRIRELESLGIFTKENANILQCIVADILFQRMKAHFFYKDEQEYYCQPVEEQNKEPHLLYIDFDDRERLEQIYSVLYQFHQCAQDFFQTKDKTAFKKGISNQSISSTAKQIQNSIAPVAGHKGYYIDASLNPELDINIHGGEFVVKKFIEMEEKQFENYQQSVSLHPTDWRSLMRLAQNEQEQKKTNEALDHYLKAYKYIKSYIPQTAFIATRIGHLYFELKQYDIALEYYQQALIVQQTVIKSNPNKYDPVVQLNGTSEVFHLTLDLAKIYFYIGQLQLQFNRNQEAVNSFLQLRKILPTIDIDSASLHLGLYRVGRDRDNLNRDSAFNLGSAYRANKDYPNAIKWILQTIEEYKEMRRLATGRLATDGMLASGAIEFADENIALTTIELAKVYCDQHKPKEALAYCASALKIHDSYSTQSAVKLTLYEMYNAMGQYQEALKYAEQFLKLAQENKGKTSVSAVYAHVRIGAIYDKMLKYQKALNSYQAALELIQKSVNQEDLSSLINVYIGIVYLHLDLGQYSKALDCFQKILNPNAKLIDKLNQETIADIFDLTAFLYAKLGHDEESLHYYERSLKIRLELFGENIPYIDYQYVCLSRIYCALNEHQLSLDFIQKALTYHVQKYGEMHVEVARDYKHRANSFVGLRNYGEALEDYNKALKIFVSFFDENHPHVAECYDKMGVLYFHLKSPQAALHSHQRALDIYRKVYDSHPGTVECYKNMGDIYLHQQNYPQAVDAYYKGFQMMYKIFKQEHPLFIACANGLIQCAQQGKNFDLKIIYHACNEVLGKDHAITMALEQKKKS